MSFGVKEPNEGLAVAALQLDLLGLLDVAKARVERLQKQAEEFAKDEESLPEGSEARRIASAQRAWFNGAAYAAKDARRELRDVILKHAPPKET